jgi:hypothetical protein
MQANKKRLGYVGKVPGTRDSNTWYTPVKYIELVKEVIGEIDLDPYSSEYANRVVGAKRIFTENDNADSKVWPIGTVFMNPPYGRGLIDEAIYTFLGNLRLGKITEAIVLTNASTDTIWFHQIAQKSKAMCFTNHRISFYCEDGKAKGGNTKGQVFFYFGKDKDLFNYVFGSTGIVVCSM